MEFEDNEAKSREADADKKNGSEYAGFHEEDKGSNRTFIIILVFILFLMGLFLVGLFFSIRLFYSPEQQIVVEEFYTYNGFDFAKIGGTWFTEIQIENILFTIETRYGPRELEDIPIDAGVYEEVIGADMIFVSIPYDPKAVIGPDGIDPNSVIGIAGIEIVRITGTRYEILNIPTRNALSEPNEQGIIVKACDDAGRGIVVILLKYGDETGVYLDNGCIVVQGTDEWEIVRAADRLVFRLLQIM